MIDETGGEEEIEEKQAAREERRREERRKSQVRMARKEGDFFFLSLLGISSAA
jgi:hypothetical protein